MSEKIDVKKVKKFEKDGIILLNKEKGISSFTAINQLKRRINVNKIGHAGTLDPMAEGLLIVMINNATKFSDDLMKKDKEYYVEMELGYETDTYDAEGEITKTSSNRFENETLEDEKIKETIQKFIGEISQIPPMYSAIKIEGKKLYELARKGIEIDRKPREVTIKKIYELKINKNKISFKTEVSSGTYIRSLVRDIGEELGTYATMTKLVRTKIDKFDLLDSIKIDEIEEKELEKNIIEKLKIINIEKIFRYDKLEINEKQNNKLKNGMTELIDYKENINKENIYENKKYKIYLREDSKEKFVGIAKIIKIGTDKIYLKRDKYYIG